MTVYVEERPDSPLPHAWTHARGWAVEVRGPLGTERVDVEAGLHHSWMGSTVLGSDGKAYADRLRSQASLCLCRGVSPKLVEAAKRVGHRWEHGATFPVVVIMPNGEEREAQYADFFTWSIKWREVPEEYLLLLQR